ncbi:MAG: peptidase, partial [Halobacteriaceae archaeon]
IKAICTEAGMFAIRDGRTTIEMGDLLEATEKVATDEEAEEDVSKTFA